MLLSTHMTSVLFLVRFNNFALTTGFYWSYMQALTQVAHSYALLVLHIAKSWFIRLIQGMKRYQHS